MKINQDTKNNIKEAIIVVSCGATAALLAAIGETGAIILLLAIVIALVLGFEGKNNSHKICKK